MVVPLGAYRPLKSFCFSVSEILSVHVEKLTLTHTFFPFASGGRSWLLVLFFFALEAKKNPLLQIPITRSVSAPLVAPVILPPLFVAEIFFLCDQQL